MSNENNLAALSDIGLHRKNNEDNAYAVKTPYGALLIVADGMGGHRQGEVASKMVVDALSIPFMQKKHVFSPFRAKHFLRKNLKLANKQVYNLALTSDEYKEMGTTAVAGVVGPKETYILSVGDSRAYTFSDEGLKQITEDQTYVEFLYKSGKITKSQMATHPQKNLLINAVGINPDLSNVDEITLPNASYKMLLLCSDGLYNMVSDEEIAEVLGSSLTLQEKAKKLIDLALLHGGNDNVAVVLWQK